MAWSLRLLTVRGIPIRVHISFLLVLLWAGYLGLVGDAARGWHGMAFMVAFVVLLFACIALHELGHGLVAQLFGVEVRDITLWPIGGVARLGTMPEKPHEEFLISAAGPATNLLVAIVLGFAALAWLGLGPFIELATTPRLLGRVVFARDGHALLLLLVLNNVILALFNLIPAFPMDGGRLLRSILAAVMPFRTATRVATSVGQVLAILMGIFGILSTDWVLLLVSLLVFAAAWQERQQVQLKVNLRGLRVRQAMQPLSVRLHPVQTLGSALAQAATTSQSVFVVEEGGRMMGVVTRGDLLRGLRKAGASARVADRMRRNPWRLGPEELLSELANRFDDDPSAVAVIIDDGQLSGTLGKGDLQRLAELLSVCPEALPRG